MRGRDANPFIQYDPTLRPMTPSLSLILYVALFWTLPATTAVIVYRRHDSSLSKLKLNIRRTFESVAQPACPEQTKAPVDA